MPVKKKERDSQSYIKKLIGKKAAEITYLDCITICLKELSDYDASPGVRVQWVRELRESVKLRDEYDRIANLDGGTSYRIIIQEPPQIEIPEEIDFNGDTASNGFSHKN